MNRTRPAAGLDVASVCVVRERVAGVVEITLPLPAIGLFFLQLDPGVGEGLPVGDDVQARGLGQKRQEVPQRQGSRVHADFLEQACGVWVASLKGGVAHARQERLQAGLERIRLQARGRREEEAMRAKGLQQGVAPHVRLGLARQLGVLRRFRRYRERADLPEKPVGQPVIAGFHGLSGQLQGLVELPALGGFHAGRFLLGQAGPQRRVSIARNARFLHARLGGPPVAAAHAPVDVPPLVIGLAFQHQERRVRREQAPFLRDREDLLPQGIVVRGLQWWRIRPNRLRPGSLIEPLEFPSGPEPAEEHVVLLGIHVHGPAAHGRLAVLLQRHAQLDPVGRRRPAHHAQSPAGQPGRRVKEVLAAGARSRDVQADDPRGARQPGAKPSQQVAALARMRGLEDEPGAGAVQRFQEPFVRRFSLGAHDEQRRLGPREPEGDVSERQKKSLNRISAGPKVVQAANLFRMPLTLPVGQAMSTGSDHPAAIADKLGRGDGEKPHPAAEIQDCHARSVATELPLWNTNSMEPQFTPAARRALVEAAGWSSGIQPVELEAPALLLGLLAETECRAAAALADCGIDHASVREHWPGLTRLEAPFWGQGVGDLGEGNQSREVRRLVSRFSAEVREAFTAIRHRLHGYPHPLMLATEHLLLGLAAADGEVAGWLRAKGIDPDALEAAIHERNGFGCDRILMEQVSAPPLEAPELLVAHAPSSLQSEVPQEGSPTAARVGRVSNSPHLEQRGDGTNQVPSERSGCERVHLLRVLDAAANRGLEGLRVVEDYARFVLDDRHLTDQLKRLRHDLAGALTRVSMASRLASRETLADVGTQLGVPSERSRRGIAEVVTANFARLQEALRSLEEFGKVLDPELAARVKQLRYQTYTLQRAVQITATSLERLQRARLYVLVDGGPSPDGFAARVRALIDAGVHAIQLRDKQLDDRTLLARARLLRELTARSGTLFIVNDRPDLAALAGADGVHVGQEELAVKQARSVAGPEALIGVSTHSIEQARQAVLDGANYLGVGPIFPSGTKQFEHFPGLALLRAVGAEIRLPAFAIGGINRENLPQVLAAGFRRIAVSGAVTAAPDPAQAARDLLDML